MQNTLINQDSNTSSLPAPGDNINNTLNNMTEQHTHNLSNETNRMPEKISHVQSLATGELALHQSSQFKRVHDDEDSMSQDENEFNSDLKQSLSPASSSSTSVVSPQNTNQQQASSTTGNNVDLMKMMLMIRQQQNVTTAGSNENETPLVRTASNSSTSSSNSACSSISSATDLNPMNENSLKQLIMSIAGNNGDKATSSGSSEGFAAAFADQFAYMVRSRSSSLSESSASSSSASSSGASSNDMLQNPATASIMKQMLNSYQSVVNTQQSNQQIQQEFPANNRKSSNASEASHLLNNCQLIESSKSNTNQTTDEVIKAKLNAVSAVKTSSTNQTSGAVTSTNVVNQGSAGANPCKVCGDEASGFHYGVDSCEGCKGFFRRCITQGMNHQCTNQQQCEMTPFSRNSCQFCRLKKCFAVGMSREASRLGRRPKRSKDEKTESGSSLPTPNITPSKSSVDSQKTESDVKIVKKEKNLPDQPIKINSIPQPPFKLDAPKEVAWSGKHSESILNKQQPDLIFAQKQKEQKEQMQQIEMLTKLISISDRHTSIERTNELEFIRTAIIDAHCQIWPTTFEKIRNRYLERPPIRATNNYNRQTNNHEVIWDTFVDAMVPLIMDVVKYCKYIPGFNQILQHDQVQLLKQGSFEVICVNSFMLVDAQNKLMLTPDMEYLMDSTTIKTMPLGFFMSEVFDLGIQVSPLKLSDAEIALFNALLVMNPDRGDLQDKDHVEELQSTLLHVLYRHLKYYRSDEPDLFCKLLKLIPIVQEINRKHSEALNTIKMHQGSNNHQQNNLNQNIQGIRPNSNEFSNNKAQIHQQQQFHRLPEHDFNKTSELNLNSNN